MKKFLASGLVIATGFVFVCGVIPVGAIAVEGETADESEIMEMRPLMAEDENTGQSDNLEVKLRTLREKRQENKTRRLAAAKLKVCETRKNKITAIINRSVVRTERQLKLFTTIAKRVQKFYTEKNLTVANYDELVAAVDAAKAKTEADLSTFKNLDGFDCSSDDPKGELEEFKMAIESMRQSLKDYRTSVRSLIVGVKTAQGEEGGAQ
jgi:hypothetical protein